MSICLSLSCVLLTILQTPFPPKALAVSLFYSQMAHCAQTCQQCCPCTQSVLTRRTFLAKTHWGPFPKDTWCVPILLFFKRLCGQVLAKKGTWGEKKCWKLKAFLCIPSDWMSTGGESGKIALVHYFCILFCEAWFSFGKKLILNCFFS